MSDKKHWQALWRRCLYPGWLWVMVLALLSAAALVYVFTAHKEATLLAYVAYVESFYALVIGCIFVWKKGQAVRKFLYDHALSSRYLTDLMFRTKLGLYPSLGLHGLYAAFHVVIGVYDRSPWFGALGVYYFVLSLTKFLLLRHLGTDSLQLSLKKYCFCGYLVLVMSLAMTLVVWQMINGHDGRQYPGYLIYVVALYAFYAFGNAIRNIIKCKKLCNPILSAAKMISFATAMVSMLSLQAAMFQSFGGTLFLRRTMNFLTGSAVCMFLFGMSLYMMIHGNWQLRKISARQIEAAMENKEWGKSFEQKTRER